MAIESREKNAPTTHSNAFPVTLGFFDDIVIPPTALQHPSRFEEPEQAWVWEYPLEDGEKHDLFMDIGEPIKFRVSGDIFEESSPVGPPVGGDKPTNANETKMPYRIVVSRFDGERLNRGTHSRRSIPGSNQRIRPRTPLVVGPAGAAAGGSRRRRRGVRGLKRTAEQ